MDEPFLQRFRCNFVGGFPDSPDSSLAFRSESERRRYRAGGHSGYRNDDCNAVECQEKSCRGKLISFIINEINSGALSYCAAFVRKKKF